MRKSLRLLLVLAMACMMSLSFFFAGSLLAKADGNVDFAAMEGASIYFAGDENDLGINYQIKLKKQDFDTLRSLPENAGKTIAFGGVYGYAYENVDTLTVETGKVVISNTDGAFNSLDDDYYVYNVELILDADALYQEEMATLQPEDVITLSEYKKQLSTLPWIIKPFYAIYEGEFSSANVIYGEASSTRMMFAIANAIEVAGEDTPFDFKDKYQFNSQDTEYVITLDAEGNLGGDVNVFTEDTAAFVVGDSAELFRIVDGQVEAGFSDMTVNEVVSKGINTISTIEVLEDSTINVYRHSLVYAEKWIDSIAIDANGKVYINSLDTEGKQIVSAYVNGVDVLKEDGTLDLALAGDKKVGDEFLLVLASETSNLFAITNAKVFDGVFEDTVESRAAFIAAVGGTAGASTEGSFALAEDLHFVEGEQFSAPNNTTFNGLFDGYGHILYNITTTTLNGIFGHFAGTCTLRNFAIKGITALNAYNGVLFRNGTTNSVVNMNNVYIYRYVTEAKDTQAIFAYNKTGTFGTWNMSNVIVEQEFDTNIAAANRKNDLFSVYEATNIEGEFNGVYFLTNGYSNMVSSVDGNLKLYRNTSTTNTRYNTLADARGAMVSEAFNYDSFAGDCWVIDADGLPVWKTCYSDAFVLDSNDKKVACVSATTTGEKYEVVVYYNSALVSAADFTLAKAEETDLVSIAGNVVTIGTGVGSVVVNVNYNGNVFDTITFNVDTREPTPINDKIIVSKANGKIYLEGTSAEEFAIARITYNGVSIYSEGAINTSLFTEVGPDNAYTLRVDTTNGEVYALTNVVVYDGVFEDTAESRAAFITAISGTAGTADAPTSTEGAYALAEDLHFVEGEEFSAADHSTFNGLFDGYGHTLYNITMTNTKGMFGYYAGTCTLRNFAIVGVTTKTASNGLLFRNSTTDSVINMSNVYIYNKVTTAKGNTALICFNKVGDSYGTWNMSNVLIEQEFDDSIAAASRNNDIFSVYPASDLDGEFNGVYFLTNGISNVVNSKDGNLKLYRNPGTTDTRYNTLADARAAMVSGNNTYDSFSDAYWIIDTDGLPAWRALQNTAE